MGNDLLTKVAKGVAFGDVSNQAVRNVLTEISKVMYGGITEQEIEDTMKYFDWKCPYTGRDLRKSIADKDGTYATDHIYPQNKDWCGLNIKGNLVIVDRKANGAKGRLDVDTFMKTDSEFWDNLGIDLPTRLARLNKIKEFQKDCKYEPDKIRAEISSLLNIHYTHIREEQEKLIKEIVGAIEKVAIHNPVTALSKAVAETVEAEGSKRTCPELCFYPEDENLFKSGLLIRKKAHFVLTYASGVKKETCWDARDFESSSSLRRNIQSKTFWRKWSSEGLLKVEVYID